MAARTVATPWPLTSPPALSSIRAVLRPEKGSPHVILAPESWPGARLWPGRGSWPGLQEMPHPSLWRARQGSSLMRGGRRGAMRFLGGLEAARFSFLGGLDDSGKRVGGRNSETLTRWRPLSLPSQEVSPPSLVSETKPCFLEELASALESQGGRLARSEGVHSEDLPGPLHRSTCHQLSLHSKCGLFPDFYFWFSVWGTTALVLGCGRICRSTAVMTFCNLGGGS